MANNSTLEAAGGLPNTTQGDDDKGGPGSWARMQTFKDKSVYVLKRTPLVNFFVFLVICPPDADNLMEQVLRIPITVPCPPTPRGRYLCC